MTNNSDKAIAIVPAAGLGARMRSDVPKQYLPMAGATVIEYTLRALLECRFIERIVVGIAAQDEIWSTLGVSTNPKISTAPGGEDRAGTVTNCLGMLADEDPQRWILVHDAARPCLESDDVGLLWQALRNDECGGLLAVPLVDTVKKIEERDRVAETLDREQLWAAQTPQMFRLGALLSALEAADDKGQTVTDEASAIELAGGRPRVVPGSSSNVKITRPEDLALAEFYINSRYEE